MFETNKKYNVTQGTHKVTNDPDEILASVLGSCIAVCAVDPVLKIGGMNSIHLNLRLACTARNTIAVPHG